MTSNQSRTRFQRARNNKQTLSESPNSVSVGPFVVAKSLVANQTANGSGLPCPAGCKPVASLETKHAVACIAASYAPTWTTLPSCSVSNTSAAKLEAPDTTPAATRVPALAVVIICEVTSLAGVTPADTATACAIFRLPQFPKDELSISADRTWKHQLTRRLRVFEIWLRLLTNLLTSPRGPFMVELFTAECLTRSTR